MSVSDLVAKARAGDLNHQEDQRQLTEEVLLPVMPEVIGLVKTARGKVDFLHQQMAEKNPDVKLPAADGDSNIATYPKGFCRTICEGVFKDLSGQDLIKDLVAQGVVFKTVYIILYGQYFQNAIQIGNIYLDSANDTVDPNKYFLEWMPVKELDYENLESWEQVTDIVESYFHCRVIPNRYFPLLAPIIPFIAIRSHGMMELIFFQDLFFFKDLGDGMRRYIDWISSEAGKAKRQLAAADEKLLQREFGGNVFDEFPFEYTVSTVEDLVQQARELHTVSEQENGETVIRKLIELAHIGSRHFKQRQLKSVE